MELNSKNTTDKSKASGISILMNIAALVVLLVGIAVLISNVVLFNKAVEQYVSQGIPADLVRRELFLSQLLPSILESFLYFAGAFILFGIGVLNNKLSRFLAIIDETKGQSEVVKVEAVEEPAANEIEEAIEVNEEVKND